MLNITISEAVFIFHHVCLKHLKNSDREFVFRINMTMIALETLF